MLMFLKQRIILGSKKSMRGRMEKAGMSNRIRNRCLMVAMSVGVWWLFFVYRFVSDGRPSVGSDGGQTDSVSVVMRDQRDASWKSSYHVTKKFTSRDALSQREWQTGDDPCAGRYVYLHDLPREFREGLLEDCENLDLWADLCKETVNMGFGQPLSVSDGVFSESGWYATNQFMLEVIFHERVKRDKCRTMDSSKADAVFVPFYSGFEVMPHLWDGANITHRDQASFALVKWLANKPEWARWGGHDHFLIGGRVTWDFRRQTDSESDWGNKLLFLPAVMNMTTLTIEASPWASNDVGVPYPTYFHPSTDKELLSWQNRVQELNRKSLFCFAGAPRPEQDSSIRPHIMAQCKASERCNLMECAKTAGKCHSPVNVMRLFQESHFCLQPPGDSYTRRSAFDSILSGCIPVFFHEYSAYLQYDWHFPADHSSYSVFINETLVRTDSVTIEEVLLQYSPRQIEDMRSAVVSLIPRIVYVHPENNVSFKDAYEISMDGLVERIHEDHQSAKEKAAAEKRQSAQAKKSISQAKSKLDDLLRSRMRAT